MAAVTSGNGGLAQVLLKNSWVKVVENNLLHSSFPQLMPNSDDCIVAV